MDQRTPEEQVREKLKPFYDQVQELEDDTKYKEA
jgi:hypothetical protein